MICVYVDNILYLSKAPMALIRAIQECYEIKSGSIKSSGLYLGATVEKVEIKNGVQETYLTNVTKIVESLLHEDGDEKRLRMTAKTPFPSN